ncbi:MAG: hypothetical protein JXA35_11665 [Deltaproteobacteria bacterium]|nr:hypothetical protein [Deltaproteobacteria bacterium]
MSKKTPIIEKKKQKALTTELAALIKDTCSISGKDTLNLILENSHPRQLVHSLPYEDFFWLLKRVGKEDCIPLLSLASENQWQYILDLELWTKDRINIKETSEWIERLLHADPQRLAKWLFDKGIFLAFHYLFNNLQIEIVDKNDEYFLKEDFFTLDGVFYIRIIDKKYKESIEGILRILAAEDSGKYQSLLISLAGLIPAENEEEMYRLKNMRLAEHGFLPFEEAIAVYSPLKTEHLQLERAGKTISELPDEDLRELIPISPLHHAIGKNILSEAVSEIFDNIILDRLRLEFAGLCNQIISADEFSVDEFDTLVKICRKAAGYINIALEKTCKSDVSQAVNLLKNNPLVSVFRAGFGQALELKWEAERLVKDSWFYNYGLDFSFWGELLGETLTALLKKRPGYFSGTKEGEQYRDFEDISDLDNCRRVINRLSALDNLFKGLTVIYPLDKKMVKDFHLTFQPLILNLWARDFLKLEPCFSGLTPVLAKNLLNLLRKGDSAPPYKMAGFENIFVSFFLKFSREDMPEDRLALKDALSMIWKDFSNEFEWTSAKELSHRFSESIWISQESHPKEKP